MTVANNGCFTARVEQPHCLLGMGSFSCVNLDGNVRRVGCCFAVDAKTPSTNPRVGTLVGVRRPSASPRKKASPKKLGMSGWMFFRVVETTRSGVKVCSIEDHSTHVRSLEASPRRFGIRLSQRPVRNENVRRGGAGDRGVADALDAARIRGAGNATDHEEEPLRREIAKGHRHGRPGQASTRARRARDAAPARAQGEGRAEGECDSAAGRGRAASCRGCQGAVCPSDVSRLFGGGVVGSRGGGVAAL